MFQGFTQQTVDFMWGIRFNNDRAWFEAHKDEYQTHLYRPMKELCAHVFGVTGGEFPQYGLKSKVSRIYRDARRLHGKGPYKDHLWWSMEKTGGEDFSAQPVFWFELAPEGWSYGMGFWDAPAATMEKHRARIDNNVLQGPAYKKPKPCGEPRLAEWYNKRVLSIGHEEELTEAIYTPALADRIVEGFTFLMPFYDYFSTLWADPDPRGSAEQPSARELGPERG